MLRCSMSQVIVIPYVFDNYEYVFASSLLELANNLMISIVDSYYYYVINILSASCGVVAHLTFG